MFQRLGEIAAEQPPQFHDNYAHRPWDAAQFRAFGPTKDDKLAGWSSGQRASQRSAAGPLIAALCRRWGTNGYVVFGPNGALLDRLIDIAVGMAGRGHSDDEILARLDAESPLLAARVAAWLKGHGLGTLHTTEGLIPWVSVDEAEYPAVILSVRGRHPGAYAPCLRGSDIPAHIRLCPLAWRKGQWVRGDRGAVVEAKYAYDISRHFHEEDQPTLLAVWRSIYS